MYDTTRILFDFSYHLGLKYQRLKSQFYPVCYIQLLLCSFQLQQIHYPVFHAHTRIQMCMLTYVEDICTQ